ncbi:MAG: right-handed parallel beta-helix repeat-containing protein, partial [Planctomycetales bacterium]|nr:right-handed parallel beta-helix repeat-containing protein [Planctomycetales bacterium]
AAPSGLNLGVFTASSDTITVTLAGLPGETIVAGAMTLVAVAGDAGGDDDFHLLASSPAIDRADPSTYYFAEPAPNGGRANLGADGNTRQATTSAAQQVQVLSPNGGQKLEAGSTVPILWTSQGVTAQRAVLRMNVGGEAIGDWLDDAYRTARQSSAASTEDAIDTSGVTAAPPATVYQQYQEEPTIGYHLPVADGVYNVRLHLFEPWLTEAGQRLIDVSLQGALVGDDVDPFAIAGKAGKAISLNYEVTATGGQGIVLSMARANENSFNAVLSAIEVSAVNPLGVADPRFVIEASLDNGSTWTDIATNQAVDLYGAGQFDWTIPADMQTDGSSALVRVSTDIGLAPRDESDTAFLIAAAGDNYYVNIAGDSDLSDNQYTTAAGDDAQSGKSPDRPMASLAALLDAYDLGPGDVVHIDTGVYQTPRNIVITANDAGVTIQGPTDDGKTATFDRGNTSNGSYVFELSDADGVTISHLSITGGEVGIFFEDATTSDQVTIANNIVFGNNSGGIDMGAAGEAAHADARIIDNTVHDNAAGTFAFGIRARGPRTIVSGNTIHNEEIGIDAMYRLGFFEAAPPADWLRVEDNQVFDNLEVGIRLQENVLVTNNVVHGQRGYGGGSRGISSFSAGTIANNQVYDNDFGVFAESDTLVENNELFMNAVGVYLDREGQ